MEPRVGEELEIKKTLYGGNHPNGWDKIRIYPPSRVRVEQIRTKTTRDQHTNEIISTRMVTLTDVRSGETYPEVKLGSLLHAAELVEEESLEGRFVPQWELHSGPEEEPETHLQRQLREVKERMESDFQTLLRSSELVGELRAPLYQGGLKVADASRKIQVLGRIGGHLRVTVLGGATFCVTEEELCNSAPLIASPTEVAS